MNTDDLKVLARRADQARGREQDRLAEVRTRVSAVRRRRVVARTTAGVVLALAVGLAVLSPRLFGDTPPPTHPPTPSTPTPTQEVTPDKTPKDTLVHPRKGTERLTLRQTVLSWNAEQLAGVASPDDPDVRLSIWRTECVVCPAGEAGHPVFDALALTRDGYETTTYLRLPTQGIDLGSGPEDLDPPTLSSPAPGVFLLVEHLNGPAWVLHANGSLRRVRLTAETTQVTDPRLVYSCEYARGGLGVGWCLLDPRRATSAPLAGTWLELGHSASNPGLGQQPWGIVNTTRNGPGDTAWWQDDGVRRTQELTLHLGRGVIRSLSANDVPTYWTSRPRARSMEIRVVRPRSGGLVSLGSRPFPTNARPGQGLGREDVWSPGFFRTPDGGLLAVSHSDRDPGLMIWRAPSLTRGAFRLVYDGRGGPPWTRLGTDAMFVPSVRDGQLQLGTLVSPDDGRTWADPVTVWR